MAENGKELYLIGMLAVAGLLSFLLRAAPFLLFGAARSRRRWCATWGACWRRP